MNRPEDSFERRFALEMAVKAMSTIPSKDAVWTRNWTMDYAVRYLEFLKGGSR